MYVGVEVDYWAYSRVGHNAGNSLFSFSLLIRITQIYNSSKGTPFHYVNAPAIIYTVQGCNWAHKNLPACRAREPIYYSGVDTLGTYIFNF